MLYILDSYEVHRHSYYKFLMLEKCRRNQKLYILEIKRRIYGFCSQHNFLPMGNDDPFLKCTCRITSSDEFLVALSAYMFYNIYTIQIPSMENINSLLDDLFQLMHTLSKVLYLFFFFFLILNFELEPIIMLGLKYYLAPYDVHYLRFMWYLEKYHLH